MSAITLAASPGLVRRCSLRHAHTTLFTRGMRDPSPFESETLVRALISATPPTSNAGSSILQRLGRGGKSGAWCGVGPRGAVMREEPPSGRYFFVIDFLTWTKTRKKGVCEVQVVYEGRTSPSRPRSGVTTAGTTQSRRLLEYRRRIVSEFNFVSQRPLHLSQFNPSFRWLGRVIVVEVIHANHVRSGSDEASASALPSSIFMHVHHGLEYPPCCPR